MTNARVFLSFTMMVTIVIGCGNNSSESHLTSDELQYFRSIDLVTSLPCQFKRDTIMEMNYPYGVDSNSIRVWVCPSKAMTSTDSVRRWNILEARTGYEIKAYRLYSDSVNTDFKENQMQFLLEKNLTDWWDEDWEGFPGLTYTVPHKRAVETVVYTGAFYYYFATYALDSVESKHKVFLKSIKFNSKN